jgi:hypothetical protein
MGTRGRTSQLSAVPCRCWGWWSILSGIHSNPMSSDAQHCRCCMLLPGIACMHACMHCGCSKGQAEASDGSCSCSGVIQGLLPCTLEPVCCLLVLQLLHCHCALHCHCCCHCCCTHHWQARCELQPAASSGGAAGSAGHGPEQAARQDMHGSAWVDQEPHTASATAALMFYTSMAATTRKAFDKANTRSAAGVLLHAAVRSSYDAVHRFAVQSPHAYCARTRTLRHVRAARRASVATPRPVAGAVRCNICTAAFSKRPVRARLYVKLPLGGKHHTNKVASKLEQQA